MLKVLLKSGPGRQNKEDAFTFALRTSGGDHFGYDLYDLMEINC